MTNARSFVLVFACAWAGVLKAQPPGPQSPAQQPPAPIERPSPQSPQTPTQAPAPDAGQPEQPYRIQVNAREVVLDVVVSDGHGHPIKGLTAKDFAVAEDGVPQRLLSVQEHNAMSAEALARLTPPAKLAPNEFSSATPVPGNTNAVTVILIDALESPIRAQMYLHEEMVNFVKHLPPGHVFAIFKLDFNMHLVQGFTSDRDALLQSVTSKRNWPSLEHLGGGRINRMERREILSAGLATIDRYMAGFPGRKNLVWFTGEIPVSVIGLKRNPFPDAIDYDARSDQAANVQSLSQVAIYPIDDRGLEVYRAHLVTGDALDTIAERSGGKATHDNNGLTEALQEITETSSDYYTIAYAPTNPVWNAHRRKIELSVPGTGDQLLYRHSYYARKERAEQRKADRAAAQGKPYVPAAPPPPTATESANADGADDAPQGALADAMILGGAPSGEVLFTVSVAPSMSTQRLKKDDPPPPDNFLRADLLTKPFREYDLLYNVDPGRVSLTPGEDGQLHGTLDYVVMVYNPEGETINSLLTNSEIKMSQETYQLALHGDRKIGTKQQIAVPAKGEYFLRIAVHDPQSDAVGALEVPVDSIRPGVAGPGLTPAP